MCVCVCVCACASAQVRKCASAQVRKCASAQVLDCVRACVRSRWVCACVRSHVCAFACVYERVRMRVCVLPVIMQLCFSVYIDRITLI